MDEVVGLILVRVVQTCSAYPSQCDAWTVEGQHLSLHYRYGEGCIERHPGPDIDTPDSWGEGLSEVLVDWDDGTGRGVIGLESFLAASGLALAPGALVS